MYSIISTSRRRFESDILLEEAQIFILKVVFFIKYLCGEYRSGYFVNRVLQTLFLML